MIETSRRSFITGLVSFVAAPAIVKAASLMPVKVMPRELEVYGRSPAMDALPELEYIRGMTQRLTHIIWYGNPDSMPLAFNGFFAEIIR